MVVAGGLSEEREEERAACWVEGRVLGGLGEEGGADRTFTERRGG